MQRLTRNRNLRLSRRLDNLLIMRGRETELSEGAVIRLALLSYLRSRDVDQGIFTGARLRKYKKVRARN